MRSAIYDDLKGRVRSLTGGAVDERDDMATVREELAGETRRAHRLLLRAYLMYCRLQGASAGRRGAAPPDASVGAHVGALRAWSLLGPSTHLLALAVASALAIRWPDAIRWYVLVAVGPATVLMIVLWPRVGRIRHDSR
jgi:hypothetical protein